MDEKIYKTEVCKEKNQEQTLNYEHHHTQEIVTNFLLDYLQNDKLTMKIYGT